ncbi:uncharacterized protein LOC131023517 [Salvia miltiorrhiza]|uniref:uncharacterized protein LOC131023517 n=1 Tax=Salvia miltiorrhiza TaxID=226208 RepID=UPI0025AC7213|nr:uncharacterized protein LOC131023517 [Salvia miltiorrhiza]
MVSKNLSNQERNRIVQYLLQNLKNGKPRKGAMKEAVSVFKSSKRTVSRLWAAAKKQQDKGEQIYLTSAKPNAPRRKRVHVDIELIQSLELHKRSTIRRLAVGINRSKSTVWRWVNQGLIRAHTSAIKPNLTAPNKLLRLQFSLEALVFDRIMLALKFKAMNNTVHVDEKWFYITKAAHRPIFSDDGEVLFDGKIGIFPFIQKVPAKRNSKNRPSGTLETKPIQSVTKEVMRDSFINQLLPAIRAKWPANASKIIYIQQDNAKPHIQDTDPEFRAAATVDGFDIRIVHQPPNSPDTNVNDLGWFRAIQSIQTESACYNVDQLIKAVEESYAQLSPHTLNKVFLSLQACMVEIMKQRGHNAYKIPHLKKDALMRANELPTDLGVPLELVEECFSYMNENAPMHQVEGLMDKMGYPHQGGLQNQFEQLGI